MRQHRLLSCPERGAAFKLLTGIGGEDSGLPLTGIGGEGAGLSLTGMGGEGSGLALTGMGGESAEAPKGGDVQRNLNLQGGLQLELQIIANEMAALRREVEGLKRTLRGWL